MSVDDRFLAVVMRPDSAYPEVLQPFAMSEALGVGSYAYHRGRSSRTLYFDTEREAARAISHASETDAEVITVAEFKRRHQQWSDDCTAAWGRSAR